MITKNKKFFSNTIKKLGGFLVMKAENTVVGTATNKERDDYL